MLIRFANLNKLTKTRCNVLQKLILFNSFKQSFPVFQRFHNCIVRIKQDQQKKGGNSPPFQFLKFQCNISDDDTTIYSADICFLLFATKTIATARNSKEKMIKPH